ncbi:hypothetical protein HMPREF0508_02308 [Lactobacillus crispatus MV-3A-US]|nr:hypothetical protein HMPREF0508_02308 [Lactobacillus crispatus MV-3A-US]
MYAPAEFTHRRNIDQIKTTDSLILALLIWQAKTGIESQRRFCECFNCLSHSRFNRRSRQLLQLIYQIRQEMNKKVDLNGQFLIIDSFPVPVCQPIRTIVLKFFAVMPTLVIRPPRKFTSMVSKFMPLLAMTVTFLIMS